MDPMLRSTIQTELAVRLSSSGFVAAYEEAEELLAKADGDPDLLEALVVRRLSGEPLSWITGSLTFLGLRVQMQSGVYEPRWQSHALAERAIARLPDDGVAVDLCTGSGAIAMALRAAKPRARVIATELEGRAVACARSNGVDVYQGDLFAPVPDELAGRVDVVVGVVPYVPTPALDVLPHDTFRFESTLAYDGGLRGIDLLSRVLVDGLHFLKPGGALLVELGGGQDADLKNDLYRLGYADFNILHDEEGDVRGIEATSRPDR
jgi:release factor glutamine methyltransferase